MQADKAAYEAKSAYDKRYARWKDAVEAKHAELVARGQLVEREVILKVLIGERVLGAKGKETEKQRERGQEALRRQRTSPPAGRGDAGGRRPSGDSPEARRRRLDGMEI